MMNILGFFAHPDDETMMAGGALGLLAHSGFKVHYYSATRGEGGEAGDPPLCSVEELGGVREAELVCAVKVLGGSSLTFLGYVDPCVGPDDRLFPFDANLTVLAGQIAASIQQHQPVAIFSHGTNGEYGHPAHLLMHQAVAIAVASLGEHAPLLYTPHAAYPTNPRPRLMNKDDPAHFVLDISSVRAQKIRAALCHRTQNAMFIRNSSKDAGRTLTMAEVILGVESFHRAFPLTPASVVPEDPITAALRPYLRQPE
jgi:LmbE family N-acetylglucosaminyl deacetylase